MIFPPGRARLSTRPLQRGPIDRHDDGNRLGGLLGGADRRVVTSDNDIDLELHQFGYQARETFGLSFRVAKFDQDVFSLHIAEISQPLAKRLTLGPE